MKTGMTIHEVVMENVFLLGVARKKQKGYYVFGINERLHVSWLHTKGELPVDCMCAEGF
jgi:hypothetical protein